ncbi:MAG: valine--tRNA ligase [Candidatus Microgenomates bacterium]|jgi:valyl-tRNA synthetase
MEPKFEHQKYEKDIYDLWEKSGAFKASDKGAPFTIIMPPPNANASLHAGHGMYVVDDILIRYKRMQGFSALWIPGMDHAGFETQFVFEKELAKKGQSRMDFDRNTLYQKIYDFVKENSGLIYEQFKRLGFSADWDRSVFTLDENVLEQVFSTFKKMESEGLVYRDDYIVNYCTHCGTSLADLEVKHVERIDPLYYIKYGPLTLATVRPETIFGDTAVAVNPTDKRYKDLVSKMAQVPLTTRNVPIIVDAAVDINFGTGALKITPAHDPNDFEIGKIHKLDLIQSIDLNGKLTKAAGNYAGLKVKEARIKVVEDLQKKGLIEKIDTNYLHSVTTCYKCHHDLEPSVVPNWFIKVKDLKAKVKGAVEKNQVHFYPAKYKKYMLAWLEIMHDWPISRQIVWGIRIPAWYSINENPDIQITILDKSKRIITGRAGELLEQYSFSEIEEGLQVLTAHKSAKYIISQTKPEGNYLQDTNTFDTWFSSGQWPLVVSRFPTSVLGTLSDILKFWVSRMIMFSLYLKNEVPFKDIYLWSMVADAKGVKMSKSKGNVINPIELVDKYGADAFRMSLIYGTPAGSKVILSDDKVRSMRNFANKIWNVARFVVTNRNSKGKIQKAKVNADDEWIQKELEKTIKLVTQALDGYKLNEAAEAIYEFIWHKFADKYIENCKLRIVNSDTNAISTLNFVLDNSLRLLHPFMPFVTEQIWQNLYSNHSNNLLINSSWPTT